IRRDEDIMAETPERILQTPQVVKLVIDDGDHNSPPKLGGVARRAGEVPKPHSSKYSRGKPPRLASLGTPPDSGGEFLKTTSSLTAHPSSTESPNAQRGSRCEARGLWL